MKFPTKAHGTMMGCSDTAPPKRHSDASLSRVYDAMSILEKTLGEDAMVETWKALPYSVKMEMNYARWVYLVR